MQNIFDSTTTEGSGNNATTVDNKENNAATKEQDRRKKRMSMDSQHNTKEAMPVLTISEARRNIGKYLAVALFCNLRKLIVVVFIFRFRHLLSGTKAIQAQCPWHLCH